MLDRAAQRASMPSPTSSDGDFDSRAQVPKEHMPARMVRRQFPMERDIGTDPDPSPATESQTEQVRPGMMPPPTDPAGPKATFFFPNAAKRSFPVGGLTKVIQLKELVWSKWESELGYRTPKPFHLKLIYCGQLMEDDEAITEFGFISESGTALLSYEPTIHVSFPTKEMFDENGELMGGSSRCSKRYARNGHKRLRWRLRRAFFGTGEGCRCAIQ